MVMVVLVVESVQRYFSHGFDLHVWVVKYWTSWSTDWLDGHLAHLLNSILCNYLSCPTAQHSQSLALCRTQLSQSPHCARHSTVNLSPCAGHSPVNLSHCAGHSTGKISALCRTQPSQSLALCRTQHSQYPHCAGHRTVNLLHCAGHSNVNLRTAHTSLTQKNTLFRVIVNNFWGPAPS